MKQQGSVKGDCIEYRVWGYRGYGGYIGVVWGDSYGRRVWISYSRPYNPVLRSFSATKKERPHAEHLQEGSP